MIQTYGVRSGTANGQSVAGQDPGPNPGLMLNWGLSQGTVHQKTVLDETGTYSLSLYTEIKIKNTYPVGTPLEPRGVKIWVGAVGYTWDDISWGWTAHAIPPSSIYVSNRALDCNGETYVVIGAGDTVITPSIGGAANYEYYTFGMTAVPTEDYERTRAYHQEWGSQPPHYYPRFDYFTDYDGCIPDISPLVNPIDPGFDQLTYQQDAVPIGAEVFVTTTSPATFPTQYSGLDYFLMNNDQKIESLLNAPFSNIKQVLYMKYKGREILGLAQWPGNKFLIAGYTNANGLALWKHEFAHNIGLDHRGTTTNPGSTNDTTALMHWKEEPLAQELNRHEKKAFAPAP